MGKMIQIRHVPDEIHKTLKIRAVEKGLSLSDYLLRELIQVVKKPSLDEVLKRIEQREAVELKANTIINTLHEERTHR